MTGHGKACLLAILLGAPCVAHAARDTRIIDDPAYSAAGRLVDVGGGRRLNLHCTGDGTPTVVFESGLGDSSKAWGLVQPVIARHTRACSYDRAGLGQSDPASAPGSAANAVADLHALLQASGEAPPYVLVGHSYGGMVAKLFAWTYPSAVAGLVLVDPAHEDVGRELFALDPESHARNLAYLRDLSECLAVDWSALAPDSPQRALCVAEAGPRYSAEIRQRERQLALTPARMAAWISEMTLIWTLSADQVRAARQPLGNLPLVVITKPPSPPAPHETPELRSQKNRLLALQHTQTAALSCRGSRIELTDSGHDIQLDQPSVVIEAIRAMLSPQYPSGGVASPCQGDGPELPSAQHDP